MYMHIDGDRVIEDRITGAVSTAMTDIPDGEKWTKVDLTGPNGPAAIVDWTSSYTETGSFGEPEKATPQKGAAAFEHAVSQLIELVQWFKDRPAPGRTDFDQRKPAFDLPFEF
jgi:creatinine amidohydrolase/Fe(II)-dependent formamide hydrolase-like protein